MSHNESIWLICSKVETENSKDVIKQTLFNPSLTDSIQANDDDSI